MTIEQPKLSELTRIEYLETAVNNLHKMLSEHGDILASHIGVTPLLPIAYLEKINDLLDRVKALEDHHD